MGVALVCVVSIGAIQFTEDEASDEFDDRAARAGAPDLGEVTDGGSTTDAGSTTDDGSDSPPPVEEEVFFGGFSDVQSAPGNGGRWNASLKVNVHDASSGGDGVEGVSVAGTWTFVDNNGTPQSISDSCDQTNSEGECIFSLSKIHQNISSVTFTLNDVSGGVPPVVYNGGTQTVTVNK